jgi:hypothetical protein
MKVYDIGVTFIYKWGAKLMLEMVFALMLSLIKMYMILMIVSDR